MNEIEILKEINQNAKMGMDSLTTVIEKVEDNEVIYYCLKDIRTFDKTDWYDRIIPSNILFNIKW